MRLLLVVLLLSSIPVQAQEYGINGEVRDKETGKAISGVNIIVDGKALAATNRKGAFQISLTKGSHIVELRYITYRTLQDTIDVDDNMELQYHMVSENQMLDQVVVSAGKREAQLKNVTVSMDMLDAGEISSQQSITLDEALERASGISIIDGQPNIRGGSGFSYGAGSRVMLLLNGLPILRGDAGYPTWNYLPMENVEQVEVIKGASSVLYGSAALNGVINMRTAWPSDTPSTYISAYSGVYSKPKDNSFYSVDSTFENGDFIGFDTTHGERAWWDGDVPFYSGATFSHRQQLGNWDVVVGGDAFLEESYMKETYTRRIRGNTSIRYHAPGNNWIAGLHVNAMKNRNSSFFFWEDDSGGVYKPFQGNITHSNGTLLNVDPFVKYYGDKGWKHSLQGRYFLSDNFTNDGKGTLNDIVYGEYEIQKNFTQIGLQMNGGVVANSTYVEAQLYGDTTHQASNYATYLQLEKTFGSTLRILGGVRYEHNQINNGDPEGRFVGRFGVNYQPFEHTFLRASVGQGYRFPTIAEKFVNTNVGALNIFPNRDLESEEGWSAEIGAKQAYQIGNIQGYVDAAAFYNTYENMMEFVFGVQNNKPGFRSENVGNTEIKGLEVMLLGRGKIGKGKLQFSTGYTYIQPTYLNFDSTKLQSSSVDYNILKYRSQHTYKANVIYEVGKFNVALHTRYFSHIDAVDAIFESLVPGVRTYRQNNDEGEWVIDCSLGYKLTNFIKAELNVNNLLNNLYSFRPGLMEAPRSTAFRVRMNF